MASLHDGDLTLAQRLERNARERQQLRQQQRDDVLRLLRVAYPPGRVFSAVWVWLEDELRRTCLDAGIRSPQSLGKHLRQWRGQGIARVKDAACGALWTCTD